MTFSLLRRVITEAVGTAMLLATIVGSGIMGERLSGGNVALALIANSIATGAALVALLLSFSAISGAHLNPVVTISEAVQRQFPWREAPFYVGSQLAGAFIGVVIAHLMFGLPLLSPARHGRSSAGEIFAELIATFGLIVIISACAKSRPSALPFAVAAYITAAYWFTSSTSFANPAVTLARSLSDTFVGIRPADTPAFIAAQLVGALIATVMFGWITSPHKGKAENT